MIDCNRLALHLDSAHAKSRSFDISNRRSDGRLKRITRSLEHQLHAVGMTTE